VQFNVAQREIVLKVVYYGPPLSGKTTNLQEIHKLLDPRACGRLTVLNTADDRTLFFDLLPVVMTSSQGYRIKLKLFTVPGQVVHAATRRIVLAGADGVVFVADSQTAEAKTNNDYWTGMQYYLKETGVDPGSVPVVIQFNKRDLPDARAEAEIETLRQGSREPIFTAVAVRGEGVLETLHGLLELLFQQLEDRYNFEQKFHIIGEEFLEHVFGTVLPHLFQRSAGGGR
jgi:signal recognition particle receptor subunit beta